MRKGMLVLVAGAIIACAAVVSAQQTKNGGPKGQVLSESVVLSASSGPVEVVQLPDDRFFLLTSFCAGPTGNTLLLGQTFGEIAAIRTTAESNTFQLSVPTCHRFPHGVALPPGEILMCDNGHPTNSSFCSVTGVLSKK